MKQRRNLKILGLAIAAVFAFSAVASANAMAAAHFHASGTGELKGLHTGNQVFTTGAGKVTCLTAVTSGTVVETEATAQKVKVHYENCEAFGTKGAKVVPDPEYNLHANGEVDVLNTIKIEVPLGFCSVTVPSQSGLKSLSYVNKAGKIEEVSKVTSIVSKGSGGLCGGENTTGTYTGNNLLELVGGSLEWVSS